MPSLKDLKVRIKSVKSTQKITKAMKMVAASKLRRAREAAEASRPYAEAMEAMVSRLAAGYGDNLSNAPTLLAGTGSDQHHLLVLCTADRGLCGGFNTAIIRSARAKIRALEASGKKVSLYCVGKKAQGLLGADLASRIIGKQVDIAKKTVPYKKADAIGREVLALAETHKVDVVSVVYNHFKSAISQVVTWQQLMPLSTDNTHVQALGYDYEPDEETILEDILPRNFSMQIFKALLESSASEHGARMNAMENATKNAGDMIHKLTLTYNRTRQANITSELVEIISGAEAV
jgi:F-type H+-transporting ATPase subunit gamma